MLDSREAIILLGWCQKDSRDSFKKPHRLKLGWLELWTLLNMDTSVTEGGLKVTLTIWLLMHGKEIRSIIGKKGQLVKKMREESGAHINISEGNCPERMITLAGLTNAVFKGFAMVIDWKRTPAALWPIAQLPVDVQSPWGWWSLLVTVALSSGKVVARSRKYKRVQGLRSRW